MHGPVSRLLEEAEPPSVDERTARIHQVDVPGLVLGSTQGFELADRSRAAASGVEVLRRRSGGGAVLLAPGSQVWVDFFIPASDPLWSDDVAHAVRWVGELWSQALEPYVAEPVSVHDGRLRADRWGRMVCFAGAGPGEVFVGGLKVVGVSQRRSRNRARIQTTARIQERLSAASAKTDPHSAASAATDRHSAASAATDRHSAASAATDESRLDELEFLDIAPADRAAGRAVMAGRCGSIPAGADGLTQALLRALDA